MLSHIECVLSKIECVLYTHKKERATVLCIALYIEAVLSDIEAVLSDIECVLYTFILNIY